LCFLAQFISKKKTSQYVNKNILNINILHDFGMNIIKEIRHNQQDQVILPDRQYLEAMKVISVSLPATLPTFDIIAQYS